jgi:predicted transcriptional regulator
MSKLLSVSIPDEMADEAETFARSRGTTKSAVVREALTQYLWQEDFRDLQAHGRKQATKRGIGPEDAEDLVDQVRAGSVGKGRLDQP